MTFPGTLFRSLGLNVLIVLTLGVIVLFAVVDQEKASYVRPAVVGSAQQLVEVHGCWTGAAPTGAVAHHAVVTVNGVARYAGQRMTDQAIEQAVFGVDRGLVVHGFCR